MNEARADLHEFQVTSKQFEEELEQELERTEKQQDELRARAARTEQEKDDWKVRRLCMSGLAIF